MSVSKLSLYAQGNHEKALGYFANIVKIAQRDGVIAEGEQKLLDRMVRKLEITEGEYAKVVKNPNQFPTATPISLEERIEHLFYHSKMVLADGTADNDEITVLRKIAFKLRFENDEKIAEEAIRLIGVNNDLEDFTLAIKKIK